MNHFLPVLVRNVCVMWTRTSLIFIIEKLLCTFWWVAMLLPNNKSTTNQNPHPVIHNHPINQNHNKTQINKKKTPKNPQQTKTNLWWPTTTVNPPPQHHCKGKERREINKANPPPQRHYKDKEWGEISKPTPRCHHKEERKKIEIKVRCEPLQRRKKENRNQRCKKHRKRRGGKKKIDEKEKKGEREEGSDRERERGTKKWLTAFYVI